jgi:uncharacterized protein (DUF2141 family)
MKKTLIAVLTAIAALGAGHAQAATVVVVFKGIAGADGSVRGALCDKDTFKKACAHKASASAAEPRLVFEGIAPGKYAFKGFHDQNDNKKLDTNFAGFPKEGFALSRDARATLGMPAFDDAAFDVKEGSNEITVTLKY